MRVLIGALMLGLCGVGSALRLEDWRSDRALMTAAVQTTPQLPQAALFLGATYLQTGQWEQARTWTQRAALLSTSRPAPPHARERPSFDVELARQLIWIDAFLPVCDQPAWARWCA